MNPPAPLSIADVIANLKQLDRTEVTVQGVLSVQRENHSLSDDPRDRDPKRRLWVYFHHATLGASTKDLAGLHGRRAIVRGVVSRQKKGHFSAFAASVNIRHLEFI